MGHTNKRPIYAEEHKRKPNKEIQATAGECEVKVGKGANEEDRDHEQHGYVSRSASAVL